MHKVKFIKLNSRMVKMYLLICLMEK